MKTKGEFLQQFRKSLPDKSPVKFNVSNYNPYNSVNVAEDDGEIYFQIGVVISNMDKKLQTWFDNNEDDELQEKLCNIFCRKYNIEF